MQIYKQSNIIMLLWMWMITIMLDVVNVHVGGTFSTSSSIFNIRWPSDVWIMRLLKLWPFGFYVFSVDWLFVRTWKGFVIVSSERGHSGSFLIKLGSSILTSQTDPFIVCLPPTKPHVWAHSDTTKCFNNTLNKMRLHVRFELRFASKQSECPCLNVFSETEIDTGKTESLGCLEAAL